MLKAVNTQRMLEIGKAAALEYESLTENSDYSSSIRRIYSRNCVASTVRPMLLMLQIDLEVLPKEQRMSFLRILTRIAAAHEIDGIIAKQNEFGAEEQSHLQYLRSQTDMIVISRGARVNSAK